MFLEFVIDGEEQHSKVLTTSYILRTSRLQQASNWFFSQRLSPHIHRDQSPVRKKGLICEMPATTVSIPVPMQDGLQLQDDKNTGVSKSVFTDEDQVVPTIRRTSDTSLSDNLYSKSAILVFGSSVPTLFQHPYKSDNRTFIPESASNSILQLDKPALHTQETNFNEFSCSQRCLANSFDVMEKSCTDRHTHTTELVDEAQPRQLQHHPRNTSPSIPENSSFIESPIVTLIVGGSQSPAQELNSVTFFVHKEVLVEYSTFFRAAFGSGPNETLSQHDWIEKESLQMHLPEDRVEDIRWLIKWLYWWNTVKNDKAWTQDHDTCLCTHPSALWHPATDNAIREYRTYSDDLVRSKSSRAEPKPTRPEPPKFGPLIRLYITADKYGITPDTEALKTLICRRVQYIARTAHCVPNREDIAHLWDHVVSENPIARMKSSVDDSNSTPKPDRRVDPCEWRLKSVVLDLFVALNGATSFDMFATQERWHAGFLQDYIVRLVHGRARDEIRREEVRVAERDARHERMREAKVALTG